MALTAKQAAFVAEYLIDLNATQAAIRAGYSTKTAKSIGDENLSKPDVAAAVAEAIQARAKRTEITADRVLKELARIGFADVRRIFGDDGLQNPVDMDDDTAAAIASVEVIVRRTPGDEKHVEHVHKIKMNDKLGALTQIGRHLGMFTDNLRHSGEVALTGGGVSGLLAAARDAQATPKPADD